MTTSQRLPTSRILPFCTPVRGHAFAARPDGVGPLSAGQHVILRREPGNPADPCAVALWLAGSAWRIGYLERAVAARIAPRLDAGERLRATLAGWWDEPGGRWRRPVVRIVPAGAPAAPGALRATAVSAWARPPQSIRRVVSPGTPPARS